MASCPDSPPKRPRLSLQIKAISNGPSGRTSRTLAAAVNPTSPTSFNTLSNVYVTAIGKSCATPTVSEPLTAIRTCSAKFPVLKLQTTGPQMQTPQGGAPSSMFPETPLTAQPRSPAVYNEIKFPSTMTATPPLSAGPVETAIENRHFSFSSEDTTASSTAAAAPSAPTLMSPRTPRRRLTAPGRASAPYTHPRSLHSILRNSPLPQIRTRSSPVSPRRQSQRLREKAARRVEYDSPLEQTITTNKYTKSHIDLLCEEAANSPYSASPSTPAQASTTPTTPADTAAATAAAAATKSPEVPAVLDLAMAYTGDETRDGGQTPGPFEEMRRRMATLVASSPLSSPSSSGIRKRSGGGAAGKRKEKKRRWVWTIGIEDENDGDEVGGAIAAARAAEAAAAGTPLATTATAATTATTAAAAAAATVPETPVVLVATPRPRSRSAAGAAKLAVVTAAVSAAISAAATPTVSSAPARAVSEEPLTAIPRPRRTLSIDTARCIGLNERPPPEQITPSIESSEDLMSQGTWSASDNVDVEMSDVSSVASDLDHHPGELRGLRPVDDNMDLDMITPTLPRKHPSLSRLGSEDLAALGLPGKRRDTPIPSDLICS